jgi:hypothetical protein
MIPQWSFNGHSGQGKSKIHPALVKLIYETRHINNSAWFLVALGKYPVGIVTSLSFYNRDIEIEYVFLWRILW